MSPYYDPRVVLPAGAVMLLVMWVMEWAGCVSAG